MNEFRTGDAAKSIGCSTHQLRRLCEAGLVKARQTDSGHWRISQQEIDRLSSEGLPPLPAIDRDTADQVEVAAPMVLPRRSDVIDVVTVPPRILQSERVIEAEEEVAITQSQLRKRQLDRQREEVEDFFRDRGRQAAAQDEQQQRRRWLNVWQEAGQASIPDKIPAALRIDARAAVAEVLENCDHLQSDDLTAKLVHASIEKTIAPWTRRQEFIQQGCDFLAKLPRAVLRNKTHQEALALAACQVVEHASIQSTDAEIHAALNKAVEPILANAKHQVRCAEAEDCLHSRSVALWDQVVCSEAKLRLQSELATLSPTDPDSAIETIVRQVVSEFEQRAKAEAVQRQTSENKQRRIDELLRSTMAGFEGYVQSLWNRYDFDEPVWTLVSKHRSSTIARVTADLSGEESEDDARRIMKRVVRQLLDIA